MKAIFEYRDYKSYLRDLLRERGRGEKSRVAQALRCHMAYLSQILNAEAQLSFEQGDALNSYLSHSEDEQDYFLLLLSHARAGTASLRKRYEEKIRRTLQERTLLENRLKLKKTLPVENQGIYYSAWYYSAIHLLISIPSYQTKEAIAHYLRLPMSQVVKALEFLVSTGLAEFANGHYRTGQVTLHLKNDSPWTPRHHASWRLRSLQSLESPTPQDFHYTSTVSMSEDDLPEVRKILVEAIEEIRAVVRKSPEKALFCYALDLFQV